MERSLEDFLRMTSQYGIPAPAAVTPPMGAVPALAQGPAAPPPLMVPPPALTPPEAPTLDPATGMPAPRPAPAQPATGFSPAPFDPPRQMARPRNADLFGDYLATLGLRQPATDPASVLPETGPPPGIFPNDQLPGFPQEAPPSRQLPAALPTIRATPDYAQPDARPGLGRYPQSARIARLLDMARMRRGM